MKTLAGVPAGSILGHITFFLFIYDLSSVLNYGRVNYWADNRPFTFLVR